MATRRQRFATHRKACGYSQESLAREIGVDPSTVRRWESGAHEPQPWHRPRICQALELTPNELDVLLTDEAAAAAPCTDLDHVPESDLSGYCGQTSRIAGIPTSEGTVLPVDRRQFIGAGAIAGVAFSAPEALGKGRQLGEADVARLSQRVSDLRRLDDFSGGASVFPLGMAEIGKLSSMVSNGSFVEQVGRNLLSVLAELYQFTSWTAFDAGKTKEARRLALAASNAANQAGNRTLGATALSELSYLTASSDKPKESVAMARASLANASEVLPVVRVVLADRLAWACARTGDARGVDRALGASEEAHDQRDRAAVEEPDTVYWINREESQIMVGRCWAELQQPKRAVPVLEGLTAPYDDTHAREVALYLCWLAGSYLDAREFDKATATASKSIELSHHTASPRTDAMLRTMLDKFRPHKGIPEVAELLSSSPL